MEAGLFNTFTELKFASRRKRISDEDFVDRINNFLTPRLICLLSVIICAKQYVVGDPLQCWVPKEFSGHWEAYAENYCWVQNTYYIPHDQGIPKDVKVRTENELNYYQWVPFVLAIQAGIFLVPSFLWKSLNRKTGLDIKGFVNMAIEASTVDPLSRENNIRMIARHIKASLYQDWDDDRPEDEKHERLGVFKIMHGILLSVLYISTKLFYVANIICQFLILQSFLGLDSSDTFFGFRLMNDLMSGRDWMATGVFPRVTMCDFHINAIGQHRKYSLQCVLVINLFNEKIYIFLWFWFTFIGIVTILSLLVWLGWFLIPSWRQGVIYKYLQRNDSLIQEQIRNCPKKIAAPHMTKEDIDSKKKILVEDILRTDGLFMLRMISNNAGEPVVNDIIMALWYDLIGVKSLNDDDKADEDSDANEDDDASRPRNATDASAPPGNDDRLSDEDHDKPQTSDTGL